MVHRIAADTAIASAQQQVTQITIALHTLVYQAVDIRGQTTAFGHYGQRKAGIRLHRVPLAIRPAPIMQPTVSRTQYVTTPDGLLPYRQTRFERSGISLPRPIPPRQTVPCKGSSPASTATNNVKSPFRHSRGTSTFCVLPDIHAVPLPKHSPAIHPFFRSTGSSSQRKSP